MHKKVVACSNTNVITIPSLFSCGAPPASLGKASSGDEIQKSEVILLESLSSSRNSVIEEKNDSTESKKEKTDTPETVEINLSDTYLPETNETGSQPADVFPNEQDNCLTRRNRNGISLRRKIGVYALGLCTLMAVIGYGCDKAHENPVCKETYNLGSLMIFFIMVVSSYYRAEQRHRQNNG